MCCKKTKVHSTEYEAKFMKDNFKRANVDVDLSSMKIIYLRLKPIHFS